MKKIFTYALITLSIFAVACGTSATDTKEKETAKTTEKPAEKETKKADSTDVNVIYQGDLHDADKTGSGTVSVIEKEDGKRVLKLSNFKTANGPDLYVYVFKAKDANDAKSLKGVERVSLGRLKSISGDQEYEVPANLNFDEFQAVSIWCEEFTVNFATAPLSKKS